MSLLFQKFQKYFQDWVIWSLALFLYWWGKPWQNNFTLFLCRGYLSVRIFLCLYAIHAISIQPPIILSISCIFVHRETFVKHLKYKKSCYTQANAPHVNFTWNSRENFNMKRASNVNSYQKLTQNSCEACVRGAWFEAVNRVYQQVISTYC